MNTPERFSQLPEYAFPRLRSLLGDISPGHEAPIQMTIGDPQHAPPSFIAEVIAEHAASFANYPINEGVPELRTAFADWVQRRYGVTIDPDTQLLALNGTREGLFNACIALCPERKNGAQPVILTPNPFYQVYAVAALTVGAEPIYVNATAETGHLPDFHSLPKATLDRTAIAYICSPANPQGAMASADYWRALITLAEQHDFLIFADECYSEIYSGEAPTGILEIAGEMGADPDRIVAFHSLSKRSNLAGLRSGFAVSGAKNTARLKQLRAYAGAPLPKPLQMAAARAWQDENHVVENRALYTAKFDAADEILGNIPGYHRPDAGFFLWIPVEDGVTATVKLWQEAGVKVLPGEYLARDTADGNPGKHFIRVALVAPLDETRRGLTRLRACLFP